jgi:hypothetical protein
MVSCDRSVGCLGAAAKRRQHIAAGVSPQCAFPTRARSREAAIANSQFWPAVAASRLNVWDNTQTPGLRPQLCAAAASPLNNATDFCND